MMRRNWAECPNDRRPGPWAKVWLTLSPKGRFVLGEKMFRQLGEPGWVRMLFDAANQCIGVQPVKPGTPNAYRVARESQKSPMIVRVFRLMAEFDVRLAETVQFDDAEVNEEGILVLDLRAAKKCVMGRKQNAW